VQQVLHLHDLDDGRQQARQRQDLDECDECRRDEDAEIKSEGSRRHLSGEERGVGVEWDGREQQGERDDEHDHQKHERVRGLLVGKARGERQSGDAETSAKCDEAEVTGRRLDRSVAMHLERERTDRHE